MKPMQNDVSTGAAGRAGLEDVTAEARRSRSWAGHEAVYRVTDSDSGLHALIAIHDRTLGPAFGGTRVWSYGTEDEAMTDVLRLSQGMTMKAALAGVPGGGGKAVILAEAGNRVSDAALRAYGQAIAQLDGRFVTAEDVGFSVSDADTVAQETRHILGTKERGGNPAPSTALGVSVGIKAAARHKWGTDDLTDRHIVIQGLGHVGQVLTGLLAQQGARLTLSDIRSDRVHELSERHGAEAVAPADVFNVEADIFSPCAMGGVINDDTVARLRVGIVAGSANNQLLEPRHGRELHERKILYAPDYVINSGGIIALSLELTGGDFTWPRARDLTIGIGKTLEEIFQISEREGRPPEEVADTIARRRIEAAGSSTRQVRPSV